MVAEPLRQPVRVNRPAELIGENEVLVDVGLDGEGALEELRLAVSLKRLHGLGIQRDRAETAL
jgi:hypothetical protein